MSGLRSVFAIVGLAVIRIGVPILGIWLLGVVLKRAVGNHREG